MNALKGLPGSKFGNKKVTIDGIKFDSIKEGRHYKDLKLRERAGEISELKIKPVYEFWINGVLVGKYTADFSYWVIRPQPLGFRVDDVKGGTATRTEAYGLRKRLMLACHNIEVMEV